MRIVAIRSRKGISPVIATIILVAMAVVIAAAVAGFSSSLFGTYSNSPRISTKELAVYSDGSGWVTLTNSGGAPDKIDFVQIPPNEPVYDGLPDCQLHSEQGNCLHDQDHGHSVDNPVIDSMDIPIPANSDRTISWEGAGTFSTGDEITLRIVMNSGSSHVIRTTVLEVP